MDTPQGLGSSNTDLTAPEPQWPEELGPAPHARGNLDVQGQGTVEPLVVIRAVCRAGL